MPQSMREQLEEAFDNDAEEETGGSNEAGAEQDAEEPLGASTEEADTGDDTGGEGSTGDADTQRDADAGDADKGGKTTAKGAKESGAEDSADNVGADSLKAPASWKPIARDAWKDVPKAVQQDVIRRERQIDGALREAADSRRLSDEFNQTIHPFSPMIAASGDSAMESVRKLMTTAAGLTIGNPVQKAQLVGGIIQQYGIDIEMLDNILSGQGGGQQNPQANELQQMLQQELGPVRQFMQGIGQQRQQYDNQQSQNIGSEIETFAADGKNEFFQDVRENMADMMEMAANRGEPMSLEQAYDRACLITPNVKDVIDKRGAQETAAGGRKRIGSKRDAASSIHGTPGGKGGSAEANSMRQTIADAWDDAV